MSTTASSTLQRGAFIHGVALPIESDPSAITNPGTGELVGRVTNSGDEIVDGAVRSAAQAGRKWSRHGYADRGKIVHACAEAFEGSRG